MDILQEKIAKRAFELFVARGGQHGYHIADWLQAEKEMTTVKAPAKTVAASKPAPAVAPVVVAEKAKAAPAAKKKTVAKK